MITKIFYSLVLFPIIKYWELLESWYFLYFIEENNFWILKLFFKNNLWEEKIIFFKHVSVLKINEKNNFLNWYVYWDIKILSNIIVNLLNADKKKDFNFFDKKILNRQRPFWVVLTITSKCNIFCYYCFNDIDYDLKERNTRKNNWLDYWKRIIDNLYNAWTRVIILTWWEPMVASFFWDLLDYLKEKNIFIHINTNWTLLSDSNLERLNKNYSVNIMVSMHEFNDNDYYMVNKKWLEMSFWVDEIPERFKTMFTDKIIQLRKIKKYKNLSIELLTILVWKNVINLDKIYNFWKNSWIEFHNWQFFRLYSTKNNKWASKQLMELAINKMYLLNKKYNVNYKIVDPVPFCVTKNTDRAYDVIDGVLSDTHDIKTIITTEWYVQLMSAYDNNFWNINNDNIKDIFKTDFVQKQLNNWFLPKGCYDCKYKEECRGWSRMDANIVYGNYWEWDPIWDIKNKKTI